MSVGDVSRITDEWLHAVVAFADDGPDENGNPVPRMVCRNVRTGDPVHHVWRGRAVAESTCLCGARRWGEYLASTELAAWKAAHQPTDQEGE